MIRKKDTQFEYEYGQEEINLVNKYPSIFRNHPIFGLSPEITHAPIGSWGFEIPLAWYSIVEKAIKIFEKYPDADARFSQIKEKFGSIRLYYDYNMNADYGKLHKEISDLEYESELLCVTCGATENIKREGYYYVCPKHVTRDGKRY